MKYLIVLAYLWCPLFGYADARVRTVVYDKSVVYAVYTQVGVVSLIQLEDDESLSSSPSSLLGIGFGDAWNLGVRGNNLALKPAQAMPQTNFVVVTNKRTYAFELLVTPKSGVPTFVLRFRYPDTEAAKAQAEALAEVKRVQAAAAAVAAAERVVINTEYTWSGGVQLLKPTAAYDDGRFTRLVYSSVSELPVFYKVLPDGTEALLNTFVDPKLPDVVVLQEVIRRVRARLGTQVIEIVNDAYVASVVNRAGVSTPGLQRVERGVQQ